MNQKQIKEIEEKILQEIKKTTNSILEYRKLTKPISPENAIGRVSRMDAINNQSVILASLRKAEEKLHKLQKVKKEIIKKDFGTCVKCKKMIPIERLLIIPEINKCVHCA